VNCPECGQEDEQKGIHFFCRNQDCSLAHFGYTAFRLGIKNQVKGIRNTVDGYCPHGDALDLAFDCPICLDKQNTKFVQPDTLKVINAEIVTRYAETFKALAQEEKKERKAAWIDKYVTNQTAQIMVMSIEAHRELMELIK
jgi:hypothetical protein